MRSGLGQYGRRGLDDDSVTLAKMASGTDGEIISWDTNGDPVAIAVGTVDHPLIGKGAGAIPVFEQIAKAGIANAAVGQSQLDTPAPGEVSTSSDSALLTLAGGTYGFWVQVRFNDGASARSMAVPVSSHGADNTNINLTLGASYLTRIVLGVGNVAADTIFAQQRYVQASPPYDLGDGAVPLFIFGVVNSLGKIESTYVAADPPWANNGPTNIRADLLDDQGRAFKKVTPRIDIRAGLDGANRAATLSALTAPQDAQMVEIDQAMKQADMPLIPHPFQGNDLTGKTVVLLDPVALMTERLLELHESFEGDESISSLLHDDYIRIDNVALSRASPPGVIAVAPRWK